MFENVSWTEIVIMGGGWISSVLTYFLGRRNREVTDDGVEIQNLKEIIHTQQEQITFLNSRISELQSQVTELTNQLKELQNK